MVVVLSVAATRSVAKVAEAPASMSIVVDCVRDTLGQRKPEATRMAAGRQILFEKTTTDVFAEPGIQDLLRSLQADRFVVYGVVTEICVRFAALGLLRTGKPVAVVRDAVQALDEARSEAFFEELRAAGGAMTTLVEIGV